jgi:hypothetical protein
MTKATLFRSKLVACGVLAAFMLLVAPVSEFAFAGSHSQAAGAQKLRPGPGGKLKGRVFTDRQQPVSGAVVKLRNLNTQKELMSPPSDAKGNFLIIDIDEGWYAVGVSTPAGDFNLTYGVYIKSATTAKLSMVLMPGGAIEGRGMGAEKGFFKTPGGIAVIVLAAAGAGFAVYALTKGEEEASPIR